MVIRHHTAGFLPRVTTEKKKVQMNFVNFCGACVWTMFISQHYFLKVMSEMDRIKDLEAELTKTKYNKRTQAHIGIVKAKIARLKEDYQKKVSGKGKTEGFTVKRSGDATVVLVGFPSVGKSTLLNAITNARSEVAAYAFTTLTCIPGLLEYKHAKVQILDVPGIIEGAASGKGRGKEVLAAAKTADLVLILLDVFDTKHLDVIVRELRETGLRLNQKPADIKINKEARGGITIQTTVRLTKTTPETIEGILKEFRLINCTITIREDINEDQLIDYLEGNKKYVPAIVVLNKIDMLPESEIAGIKKELRPDTCISAHQKVNLDGLKELIYQRLALMRIYCKEPNKKADTDIPLIIKKGSTLQDYCLKLHKDFVAKFRFARVWGKSVKFPGMRIMKLSHVIADEDIVEVHLK